MNFIKNQIMKIANLAIIAGLGLTAVGLWTMFEERSVSSEPAIMDLASLDNQGNDMAYATVSGGSLNMNQVYEYSLQTRKRKTTLSKMYFIPVTDPSDNSVAYILGTKTEPASLNLSSAGFTGLLQNSTELPGDISGAYNQAFQGQSYRYLDESYEPKSMAENLGKVGLFLGIAIAGYVARLLLGRKRNTGRVESAAHPHKQGLHSVDHRRAEMHREDPRRGDYRNDDRRGTDSRRA